MTLRYKLLRIPGNLDEFIEKEKKKDNRLVVDAQLFKKDSTPIISHLDLEIYICSADLKRKYRVGTYNSVILEGSPDNVADRASLIRGRFSSLEKYTAEKNVQLELSDSLKNFLNKYN